MTSAPLILVSPSTDEKGAEFYDFSLSLSECYPDALAQVGGLPVVLPCHTPADSIAELVRRADGVMLTGGDDIQPELYDPSPDPKLRATVGRTDPKRDVLETLLVREVFAQRKPLLAICRGHQMLNIALGGTLLIDIPSQHATTINHAKLSHKDRLVHDIALEPGSLMHALFGASVGVNSSHHQAIAKLAPPLRVTARAPDGIIEAVELRPADAALLPYLLSVQFHPERLTRAHPEFVKMFRSFVEACARKS
jgi:putative glutamine amidotransferase